VLFELEDGVGVITLNRPDKRNALNLDMFDHIRDALEACRGPACRAVVLQGAGPSFCAGDDISPGGFGSGDQRARFGGYGHRNPSDYFAHPGPYWLVQALRFFPKPVVAGIQGHCAAIGADLALACDFRVAADDCRLSWPYAKLGMVGGTWLLERYVGLGRATELLLTGDQVDAATAHTWGLVTKVTPPERRVDETRALAARLADGPTKALGYTKEALNRGMNADLVAALEYMIWANGFSANASDRAEGIHAFLEKRPPRYTGQ
jgi:enoyl-CoA hydratase/carnithine racemase